MAKRNAKRMMKRMQRESGEYKSVVDACIFMASQHGITINFPWEVPNLLEALLQERRSGVVATGAAQVQAHDAHERLAQLTGHNGASQPAHPHAQPGPPPVPPSAPQGSPWAAAAQGGPTAPELEPPPPPVDPWAAAAEGAFDDIIEGALGADQSPAAPAGAPTGDEATLSQEEMMARYQAGQDRMISRVETTGVQYKHGQGGPATGQRMVAHDNARPAAPPAAPGAHPPPPAGFVPAEPRNDDGSPRMKGGMSRTQALDLIERSTGRRPSAPGGNPTQKPAGF
jgi:hypothetical protein